MKGRAWLGGGPPHVVEWLPVSFHISGHPPLPGTLDQRCYEMDWCLGCGLRSCRDTVRTQTSVQGIGHNVFYLFILHILRGLETHSLLYLRCRNTQTVDVTKTFVVIGDETCNANGGVFVKDILIDCPMMSGVLPPAIE
jgi:hypothetical protein